MIQPAFYLFKNPPQVLDIKFTVKLVEDLYETAHMSTLEPVRQINKHIEIGHCPLQFLGLVQHHDRVGNILYPHLLYIDAAVVTLALDILHGENVCCLLGKPR